MIALLCLCAQPAPPPTVQFDHITVADARPLSGATVRIEFRPDRPEHTWPIGGEERTVTGPAELDDGQERTVVLRGNRLGDLRTGKRIRAVGVLRVIDHPAAAVNGVLVPEWTEIRFEER
ncbi:hypothetical protein GobsT_71170 [Gemmata obscuriglobus]|uniref:Uncharacterized protein n=1 Tax=Gemmata obscuriglobus TaxID=114 RepID=A0A2Z3HDH3_9BACT|nr:hypothetical protein [Gemmata obscuriglobus]AWM41776.1 hypothetical protein C1280_35465 [Gemmata obscuriglobus]QEG32264.1 hypothetical protein GobsT_71170 [Gemmata obscuriglobus]VTS11620.1 unnamed protein product [Gemmata obscuriglobus UQM 2246]